MPGEERLYIVFGPEWERVKAALTAADVELPDKLHDDLRKITDDLVDIAKAKVNSLPTPSNAGHTGLRRKVGEGVHVIDTSLDSLRVETSMIEPNESIIPAGLDRASGWRHPLFGNKNYWYSNPGYSWFNETFESGRDDYEDAFTRDLEQAADSIG